MDEEYPARKIFQTAFQNVKLNQIVQFESNCQIEMSLNNLRVITNDLKMKQITRK